MVENYHEDREQLELSKVLENDTVLNVIVFVYIKFIINYKA